MKDTINQTIQIFCQNIRTLRKATGLSIKDMAKRLRIGPKTLSSLERGILPPRLSCEILFRIEDEFGVKPRDMIAERSSEPSSEQISEKNLNFFSKTP